MKKIIPFLTALIFILNGKPIQGQETDLDNAIKKNRMGTITVECPSETEVLVEQLEHEFWFGCAISNGIFSGSASEYNQKMYKEKFLQNFNSAVTENAVKWGNMEPRRGEVNYKLVDAMLEWTEENNLPLRAHNLFWGIEKFVQPWVKELSDEELEKILENRAKTITSKYKGRFAEYDLNNEMIHGNYYEERLGKDITRKMAKWAQNGDPGIKIYLNDYDILTGNKLDDFMGHIRDLLSQGIRIEGIGVQGHLHGETFDRSELQRSLDSLAVFDLEVKITEFNMPGQRSSYYRERIREMSDKAELQKAKDLVDYYKICFAHPAVDGILMWGFWAGANWIPVSSLYKKDWSPTPAAEAYQNLIYNEWWTSEKSQTDSSGTLSIPAFYGKYRITANRETKIVNLKKSDGNIKVVF